MLETVIEGNAIRIGPRFAAAFHRTLRIPDDGKTYPLPPGLGKFPLYKVETYRERVPAEWREQGGVFIPMYQREAMWIGFHAAAWRPNAVKVSAGRINAVTGRPHQDRLTANPQDYLVCPEQLWLDGINVEEGAIRQFVAMPLGLGYTVEAALTGEERYGGLQIAVFEPKPGKFPDEPPKPSESPGAAKPRPSAGLGVVMGLGAGGRMRQKIYPDPYGADTWDQENFGRITVHIVNSEQLREITGESPPPTPIDAEAYTKRGLPWFTLYEETRGDVAPSDLLAGVKGVAEIDSERGEPAGDQKGVEIDESQIQEIREDRDEGGSSSSSSAARKRSAGRE